MKQKIYRWLNSKSQTFSTITGEDVTRKEVVLVNGIAGLFFMAALAADISVILSVVMLSGVLYLIHQFNQ